MHHVPPLPHDFSQGVPGLLSAEGFDIAWTQYMTLMMEKLNALTAGTEYEQKEVKTIVLNTAREPAEAPIFNHASMAHNNHFFFKRLSPKPVPVPESLRAALEESFSSLETLRREFVVTASAMFGPGFVWLVKVNSRDAAPAQANPFRLLTTYLAGSPYPGAHWRRQSVDRNTVAAGDPAAGPLAGPTTTSAAAATGTAGKTPAPGGIDITPVLCLNTWEHVWLRDYGFGVGGYGGKRQFVEQWWETIDWEAVASDANITRPAYRR
ncbi:hypothetical protein VTK73DRAFT_4968 [Phialemonium thermophilum]|uniref:Manganese/iron superoxide dismutase C-terminal domain-containing protein n=1 Tax=Phialemonium thermophilum TaxID=223376 RepID=A0ABR3XYX8_9PEZI